MTMWSMRRLVLLLFVAGGPTAVRTFLPKVGIKRRSFRSRTLRLASSNAVVNNKEIEGKQLRSTGRVAVLLCPAQFCVPKDYDVFFENLEKMRRERVDGVPDIAAGCVAPLARTDWIKVARSLPTRAFLEARLPVLSTLDWYFEAIEKGLSQLFATVGEDDDVGLCIIGHSIGGWVARAYLGGLSRSSTAVWQMAMERCTSLVTLGTPHTSPADALVDQTRGLLREIAETPACSAQSLADRGIDVTCVCSNSLSGNFLTTNVEEIIAASSYLPLLGRIDSNVQGDGIVPLDLAFMEEPARQVIIDQCSISNQKIRHSHVVPTPWNLIDGYAPSIRLSDQFASYVTEGVLPQWAKYIR